MIRLFVALRPPPAVRSALLAVMAGVPGARWQDDAQLHLTLRYIGEVDEPVAEEVALALSSVGGAMPVVRLAGVGRSAKAGRTHTLWAEVAPHEPLAALNRKIDHALVRIGLLREGRAYWPHITLARLSRGAGAEAAIDAWIAAHAALTSAPFAMEHVVLYESILGGEGALYEAVARWALN